MRARWSSISRTTAIISFWMMFRYAARADTRTGKLATDPADRGSVIHHATEQTLDLSFYGSALKEAAATNSGIFIGGLGCWAMPLTMFH
jgi:hypothetical protein